MLKEPQSGPLLHSGALRLLLAPTTLLGVWLVSSSYPFGPAESHLGDQGGCKHRTWCQHPATISQQPAPSRGCWPAM